MKTTDKFRVTLTKEILEQAKRDLEFWQTEGPFVFGVHEQCSFENLPDWIDQSRVLKAQKIAKDMFGSLGCSALIGLQFVIQLPKGLGPLLATGNSKNASALFSRYLNTVLHVSSWYRKNLFDPKSKAHKSIKLVRCMHKKAGEMMNKKYDINKINFEPEMLNQKENIKSEESNNVDTNERKPLWVNQLDMLLTQWAFIGPIILEPEQLGVYGHGKESIEEIIYFWAVIGHLIGIHPKFNLFYNCNYTTAVARCKLILENIYMPALTQLIAPVGAQMSFAIFKSMQYYNKSACWAPVMQHAYHLFNIDAKRMNKLYQQDRSRIKAEKEGKPFVPEEPINQTQYTSECVDENGNAISEEERKRKLLAAGYNDRYEVKVWDGLPREKIKMVSRKDIVINSIIHFQLNYLVRFKFMRAMNRKLHLRRQRNAFKNRDKFKQDCSNNYDENWHLDRCPFSGQIDYQDISLIL